MDIKYILCFMVWYNQVGTDVAVKLPDGQNMTGTLMKITDSSAYTVGKSYTIFYNIDFRPKGWGAKVRFYIQKIIFTLEFAFQKIWSSYLIIFGLVSVWWWRRKDFKTNFFMFKRWKAF